MYLTNLRLIHCKLHHLRWSIGFHRHIDILECTFDLGTVSLLWDFVSVFRFPVAVNGYVLGEPMIDPVPPLTVPSSHTFIRTDTSVGRQKEICSVLVLGVVDEVVNQPPTIHFLSTFFLATYTSPMGVLTLQVVRAIEDCLAPQAMQDGSPRRARWQRRQDKSDKAPVGGAPSPRLLLALLPPHDPP